MKHQVKAIKSHIRPPLNNSIFCKHSIKH